MDILLKTHRKLRVKRLVVDANIGVYEHEKQGPQPIWFTIEAWVRLDVSTPNRDHIEEVVDYDFLRDTTLTFAHECHHALLETLAEKILDALLAHSQIDAVRLLIEKPDIFEDCESIGIETYREKPFMVHGVHQSLFC